MTVTAISLVVLIVAAAALLLHLTRRFGRASDAGSRAPAPTSENAYPQRRPASQLPILDCEALLARSGATGYLRQIEDRSGFAPENFARDCLPVLCSVAEYVQLFPASEAHHHAQEGGLLIHLLETAAYALHFREGLELPLAAPPEERARLKHRWTYGVFLAALLHDIGKPLADLRITLYASDPITGTPWRAFAGALTEAPGATHYTVEFACPSERDYDEHRRLGFALAQSIVPQHVRLWLAEDPAVVRELAAYLNGDGSEGVIAGTVRRADAESVRFNLRHGPRTRFASARVVPLIERLMAGLRRMLAAGGHLPLNKPGAAGWVYRGEVWFVSKRVADAVRDYLNREERRGEEAPGIPEGNERLFDTWCEYNACVVNPETNGAVWTARVEMGAFRQRLTLLRFPLGKLYPEPNQYPKEMEGRIVVQAKHEAVEDEPEGGIPDEAATAAHDSGEPEPVACVEKQETAATEAGAFLDEADAAHTEATPAPQRPPPPAPSAPVAPAAPRSAAALLGAETKPPSKSREAALRFFAWIQHGIADGSLKYNAAEARIHFVPEGMLLVSPGTFRDYAAAFGDADSTDPANGKSRSGNGIQNAVKRSGLVMPAAKGNYLHRYQVLRGGTPGGFLNCFLMPKPDLFFNPVPPPNPLLRRFVPKVPRDGTLSD